MRWLLLLLLCSVPAFACKPKAKGKVRHAIAKVAKTQRVSCQLPVRVGVSCAAIDARLQERAALARRL